MDTCLTTSQIGINTVSANGDIIGWIAICDGVVEEDVTAIRSINNEQSTIDNEVDAIYDLQGRSVNEPIHGFYIVRLTSGRMQGKIAKKIFLKKR